MFKPYRGTDVMGHVQIRGIWMTAERLPHAAPFLPPGTILVSRLGWGDTYAGELRDFTPDEQALVRTTLDKGATAKDEGNEL